MKKLIFSLALALGVVIGANAQTNIVVTNNYAQTCDIKVVDANQNQVYFSVLPGNGTGFLNPSVFPLTVVIYSNGCTVNVITINNPNSTGVVVNNCAATPSSSTVTYQCRLDPTTGIVTLALIISA